MKKLFKILGFTLLTFLLIPVFSIITNNMTINNFEQYVDLQQLQKGLAYYSKGSVHHLEEKQPGLWRATIAGSEVYSVTIALKRNEISEVSCTCPHQASYCKHVVAVLYAIKGKADKVNFIELVNSIPETELKQFVIAHGSNYEGFKNIVLAHFASQPLSGLPGKDAL